MMRMGYARVATDDQNLSGQLELLHQAGCERIVQEQGSGLTRDRETLRRMLDHLRPGDTVVVWKLDRFARSTRGLLETVEQIHRSGAHFQSLSEPWAETTSHVGTFIMTIFAGLAECERELTMVGRKAARRRGVRFGRPPKLSPDQRALARRLRDEGQSAQQVATMFGVHVATIYRFIETSST